MPTRAIGHWRMDPIPFQLASRSLALKMPWRGKNFSRTSFVPKKNVDDETESAKLYLLAVFESINSSYSDFIHYQELCVILKCLPLLSTLQYKIKAFFLMVLVFQSDIDCSAIKLKPSEYVLVWVREQNRAFIMDFWVPCNFSPVVVTFHHTPQTTWLSSILWLTSLPHSVPKWLAKNRPSMKSLVHYISHFFQFYENGGHKWCLWGSISGYVEVLQLKRILLWS